MIDRFHKTDSRWWSVQKFFVFNPDFNFHWKIKTRKDFVLEVKVKCYGVLAAEWMPHLYKCKAPFMTRYDQLRRRDSEIFESFEECLSAQPESFDEDWINKSRANLVNSISVHEHNAKSFEFLAVQKKWTLQKFDSLISWQQ